MDALWYIDSALEMDICDPSRHKYSNLPNLCNINLTTWIASYLKWITRYLK